MFTVPPKYHIETYLQVASRIKRSRSTLYAMGDVNSTSFDPTFPKPVPLGPPSNPTSSVGFVSAEIDAWVESRMATRSRKP